MDTILAVRILREVAEPGSGHLFSRREAARHAADLIEQQAARIAELEARAGEAKIYQLQQVNGAWLDVSKEKFDAIACNYGRVIYTHPPTGDAAGKDSVDAAVCKLCRSTGPDVPCAYPTEINRQQAKRIADLLRERDEVTRVLKAVNPDAYVGYAAIASLTKTADGEKT
jgi:hypothetical protein